VPRRKPFPAGQNSGLGHHALRRRCQCRSVKFSHHWFTRRRKPLPIRRLRSGAGHYRREHSVSDAGSRIVFAPAPCAFADPYALLSFVANDWEATSAAATVTIPHHWLAFRSDATATRLTETNATLNGMASPNGLAGLAWFEWAPLPTSAKEHRPRI